MLQHFTKNLDTILCSNIYKYLDTILCSYILQISGHIHFADLYFSVALFFSDCLLSGTALKLAGMLVSFYMNLQGPSWPRILGRSDFFLQEN